MDILIEGNNVRSEADLHEALMHRLDFGSYYGKNLAALRDRLSNDVERPVHLIWQNSDVSRRQLGDDLFNKIVAIFKDVEAQDISFGWEDRFSYSLG